MNTPAWRVEDDGGVQLPVSPTTEAGLVSLPFLAAAVRRRLRRVVATAVVCVFLALALLRVMGGQQAATVTLFLVSDPTADPSAVMVTNLSLAHTLAVSQGVVDELRLPVTAKDFQATVMAGAESNQVMTLTVAAPSAQAAIKRVAALASVYLDFRNQQLSALANSTVSANQKRVDGLNLQIADLTKRYDVAYSTPGQEQTASTLLTERTRLQAEVDTADQQIAQTELETQAITDASHIVDAPTIVHKSGKKAAVLAIMSGLIGGTALGLGLVLAPAVMSRRLRRRDDVARALGLPVRFSAGAVRSRLPWMARIEARRNADRLAHGLATALPDDDGTARLTVATVGDVRDGAAVVGALADELARESTSVAVIDLSVSGALSKRSRRLIGRRDPIRNRQLIKVHRHDVRVSELSSRSRIRVSSDKDLGRAEVILTLIELDLGTGMDALGDLADACVVLISTGCASAERLRSSATLLRQSGIQPSFAMLVGADDTDDSSGLLETFGHGHQPARRSS
jgi:capsular polysaccharide biosynthesis protein